MARSMRSPPSVNMLAPLIGVSGRIGDSAVALSEQALSSITVVVPILRKQAIGQSASGRCVRSLLRQVSRSFTAMCGGRHDCHSPSIMGPSAVLAQRAFACWLFHSTTMLRRTDPSLSMTRQEAAISDPNTDRNDCPLWVTAVAPVYDKFLADGRNKGTCLDSHRRSSGLKKGLALRKWGR